MQKPSLGRIVLVTINPLYNNGADVAPAIVTRVWSDTCVNLRVLADSNETQWKTSVPLWESREALDANYQTLIADGVAAAGNKPFGAFWPPRVP